MEKKKALGTVKIVISAAYLLVFLAILVFEFQAKSTGSEYSPSSLFYWMILFGWIGLIWNFRWKSSASLIPAFVSFVTAALFIVVGFRLVGEIIMRVSFIWWMIGVTQALLEYKKNEKK